MFKHILVPLDGSQLAELAIPAAIELARKVDGVLCLLRVVPQMPAVIDVPFEIDMVDTEEAEKYLDDTGARLSPHGVPLLLAIRHGRPAQEILDYAVEVRANAIVMTTHGRSGFGRLAMGSVAEEVVRDATCPVLLLQKETTAPVYRRILVPLDATPGSAAILPAVSEIAQLYESEIILVHANIAARTSGEPVEDYLAKISEIFRETGIHTSILAGKGDPQAVILDAIQEFQPDLIAMATHARPLLGRAIYGSVAHDLLRHTAKPLLLYRYAGLPVPPMIEPSKEKLQVAG